MPEGQRYDEVGAIRPSSARMYDYFLGGKSNYGVDRAMAAKVLGALPHAQTAARANRDFMHRAVRTVAREQGIDQFLDIGTGIPTRPNLHDVAQGEIPGARVVYCDNDDIVLAYARALMPGPQGIDGTCAYVHSDARDTDAILSKAQDTLDLTRPVALSLVALLHFVPDEDDPHGIVRQLMEPLAPGSALILSHATGDFDEGQLEAAAEIYRKSDVFVATRERAVVKRFFAGTELLEPGLAASGHWRFEEEELVPGVPLRAERITAAESGVWAGVGIKTA